MSCALQQCGVLSPARPAPGCCADTLTAGVLWTTDSSPELSSAPCHHGQGQGRLLQQPHSVCKPVPNCVRNVYNPLCKS